MAQRVAIPDTTSLIGLHATGALGHLCALFAEVLVPLAVARELALRAGASEATAKLPCVTPAHGLVALPPAVAGLDPGEAQVIARTLMLGPEVTVLLDERQARKVARRLGLTILGTLGVLVEAKQRGLLTEVAPLVTILQARNFHLSPEVIAAALRAAGETPR